MKPQTTFRLIGLAIVIICILATPKEKEKPLKFDSGFLKEAEELEILIEFRNEKTNN